MEPLVGELFGGFFSVSRVVVLVCCGLNGLVWKIKGEGAEKERKVRSGGRDREKKKGKKKRGGRCVPGEFLAQTADAVRHFLVHAAGLLRVDFSLAEFLLDGVEAWDLGCFSSPRFCFFFFFFSLRWRRRRNRRRRGKTYPCRDNPPWGHRPGLVLQRSLSSRCVCVCVLEVGL